ncbi:MAG: MFS transporter [Rhodospirillaceae bacterium]|nr:MFS transporter [Rhodospirillaceae bacterium]
MEDFIKATGEGRVSKVDSSRAWWRLIASLVIGSVGGVGMWSSVVLLPEIERYFVLDRSQAALPYTVTMMGIVFGNVLMGRMVDRFGVVTPTLVSAFCLGLGYLGIAFVPNFWLFLLYQGILIGILGTSGTFGPMISSVSLWFLRHRGIAVSLVATGSYIAGTIWPPILRNLMDTIGWQNTHLILGAVCFTVMVPFAIFLRGSPPVEVESDGHKSVSPLAEPPFSLSVLQLLLIMAGVACCVAMSMPQVHIVAYCVDLKVGAQRGAEMLSIMFGLGVISRIAFGFLTDRIGAPWALFIGSLLQAVSLLLFLPADNLTSLYLVSALFGLFQGGIVPAYAVIIRNYYPANQAGFRVGLVLSATMGGMAFGGWLSGEIFDLTLSYEAAFLNGFAWNIFNLAIVALIIWRIRRIVKPIVRTLAGGTPALGRWPGPLT